MSLVWRNGYRLVAKRRKQRTTTHEWRRFRWSVVLKPKFNVAADTDSYTAPPKLEPMKRKSKPPKKKGIKGKK